MTAPRALVTGATGFVGRYLVRALSARGEACRVLVRNKGRLGDLGALAGLEVHEGDLLDPASLGGMARGVRHVYHLAAEGHVSAMSDEAYRRFMAVNVDGVQNVLRACQGAGVEKFVHFSSTAAMGLIQKPLVDETDPPEPATPYQKSKRQSEEVALSLGAELGIPTLVLRPCMIYGVGGEGEFKKICSLMRRGLFPKVGLGKNLTPLVHVEDVVQAAMKAAERGRPGEVYLVASRRSIELDELRRLTMRAWGTWAPYPFVPVFVMNAIAHGFEIFANVSGTTPMATRKNVANTVFDREFSIDKARRDFGYEPAVAFSDGISRTIEWFKDGLPNTRRGETR